MPVFLNPVNKDEGEKSSRVFLSERSQAWGEVNLSLPLPSLPPQAHAQPHRRTAVRRRKVSREEEEGPRARLSPQSPPGRPSKARLSSRATSNRNGIFLGQSGGGGCHWPRSQPTAGKFNTLPRAPTGDGGGGSCIRSGERAFPPCTLPEARDWAQHLCPATTPLGCSRVDTGTLGRCPVLEAAGTLGQRQRPPKCWTGPRGLPVRDPAQRLQDPAAAVR